MKDETYTREKLRELCQSDPEAIINLIESLMKTIRLLNERVKHLERQLNQDSHNSSKPPSSDGMKRIMSSTREKSNRQSGGQKGHKGTTLLMKEKADKIIEHRLYKCLCGCSLKNEKLRRKHCRQVIDIPTPQTEYTEHQSEEKQCPNCGAIMVAPFPEGVEKVIQYGINIKSLALSLIQYQLIPLKRTEEFLKDIFSVNDHRQRRWLP